MTTPPWVLYNSRKYECDLLPIIENLNLTHWCMWPVFSRTPAFQDLRNHANIWCVKFLHKNPKSITPNIRSYICTTSEISTLKRSTCIFRDLSSSLVTLFQRVKRSWKAWEIHLTEYSPTAVASSHPVCVWEPLHFQSSTKILMLQDSTRFLNYSPFPGKEMKLKNHGYFLAMFLEQVALAHPIP